MGIMQKASAPDASESIPAFAWSIRRARQVAQPAEYSPAITDGPYRAVSIFPSLLLARLGIAPNLITTAWGVLGLVGVIALGRPQYGVRLAGALLLQMSYLLDFVDGEVARLLNRTSDHGSFIDLVCHGLIKSSLFLAVGYGQYVYHHRAWALLPAFVACVSLSGIYSLPFLATAAKVREQQGSESVPRPTRSTIATLRDLLAVFPESPGLFALVLLGAAFNRLSWVLLLYGVLSPLWFLRRLLKYCG